MKSEWLLAFWRWRSLPQRWAMHAGQHRYVISLKQSKRVWEEFGWGLLPAPEC